ncbi:unnamed protein product [Linum tenue]|uniref:S-protein homolog n=2 Tax=Linum tenue TaxID=586396 RepID=A0AAV0L294_9ROSI|nr:unnamed protein product [Linum tenue]
MIFMARPSIQDSVYVTNKLRDKMLMVHCRSKDDDLGAHGLAVGESFEWSFDPSWLGETLFWCSLAVEDKCLSFVAYYEGDMYTEYWYVHDDGVYGQTRHANATFYEAPWRRVSPRQY